MKIRFPVFLALAALGMTVTTGRAQTTGTYGNPSPYYQQPAPYTTPAFPNAQFRSTAATNPWSTPRVASNTGPCLGPNGNFGPVTHLPPTNMPAGPGPVVESGPAVNSDPMYAGSPYMQAMSAPWDAAACGTAPSCLPLQGAGCPKWFGGVYGLIMDMAGEDPFYFVMPPSNPGQLYLTNNDAGFNSAGGVEARFGRTFCNCKWGLEFVYWGIFPDDSYAHLTPSSLGYAGFYTTMDYRDVYLDFTNGAAPNTNYRDTIDNYFNGANPILAAEICRSWDIQNFELNLLSGPLVSAGGFGGGYGAGSCGAVPVGTPYCGGDGCGTGCGGCCPNRLFVGWLFGVRYFKFDEYLCFTAENDNGTIDYNSPNDEFMHEVDVSNDLVGAQLGVHMDYFLTKCFQLQTGSAFGIYGNNMDVYQRIYNGNGNAYTDPTNPNWLSQSDTDDDVAFLGELRAGLGYKIGCHCRLVGGYRAVAACGVARTFDQLPSGRMFADQSRLSIVDKDGCVVLHGAYAGAEFAW